MQKLRSLLHIHDIQCRITDQLTKHHLRILRDQRPDQCFLHSGNKIHLNPKYLQIMKKIQCTAKQGTPRDHFIPTLQNIQQRQRNRRHSGRTGNPSDSPFQLIHSSLKCIHCRIGNPGICKTRCPVLENLLQLLR